MNNTLLKSLGDAWIQGKCFIDGDIELKKDIYTNKLVEKKLHDKVNVLDFAPNDIVREEVIKNIHTKDCTPWLQDAVDHAHPGQCVIFPQGVYPMRGTLFVKKKLQLKGEGKPILKGMESNREGYLSLIHCYNPMDTYKENYDVIGNIEPFDESIENEEGRSGIALNDTQGLNSLDWVLISSEDSWNDGNRFLRQWVQLAHVDHGNNRIFLDHTIFHRFSQKVKIIKLLNMVDEIKIMNLSFIGSKIKKRGLSFRHIIDLTINDCYFENLSGEACNINKVISLTASGNHINGRSFKNDYFGRDHFFYGFYPRDVMQITFVCNIGRNIRRLMDCFGTISTSITAVGNHSYNCIECIGGHAGDKIVICDNIAIGCNVGRSFQARGQNVLISNNIIESDSKRGSIMVGDASSYEPFIERSYCGNVTITGNKIICAENGIIVNANSDNVLISNNNILVKDKAIQIKSWIQENSLNIHGNIVGRVQRDKLTSNRDFYNGQRRGIIIECFRGKSVSCLIGQISCNSFYGLINGITYEGAKDADKWNRGIPSNFIEKNALDICNNIFNSVETPIRFGLGGFHPLISIRNNTFANTNNKIIEYGRADLRAFYVRPYFENNIVNNNMIYHERISDLKNSYYMNINKGRFLQREITENDDLTSSLYYCVTQSGVCSLENDDDMPWGENTGSWTKDTNVLKTSVKTHIVPNTFLLIDRNGEYESIVIKNVLNDLFTEFELDKKNNGNTLENVTIKYQKAKIKEI